MHWNVVKTLQDKMGLNGLEVAMAACLVSIVFLGLVDLWKMVEGW